MWTCDVRPVDEAGRDRIHRVAPPVRREVGAGDLEHARAVARGVEVGRRLLPVVGDLLRTLEVSPQTSDRMAVPGLEALVKGELQFGKPRGNDVGLQEDEIRRGGKVDGNNLSAD